MKDTYSYRGWLNSDFFWKRAIATSLYSSTILLIIWLFGLLIYIISLIA